MQIPTVANDQRICRVSLNQIEGGCSQMLINEAKFKMPLLAVRCQDLEDAFHIILDHFMPSYSLSCPERCVCKPDHICIRTIKPSKYMTCTYIFQDTVISPSNTCHPSNT